MSIHPCHVVPPYLLDRIATSGDPRSAAFAAETLHRDAMLRADRERHTVAPATRSIAATAAAPHRTIHDAHGSESLPGAVVRTEGTGASTDSSVDNVYDGFGAVWAFYWDQFERNSIDDAGLPLIGTVHYGSQYDNAFWNGEQMVFGDGDGEIFGDFTASLDVIGHELTHGVTEHTANLTYSGQSGALNESVSDVFGVLVAQFSRGEDAASASWLVGQELLLPGVKGTALRSMLRPGTAYDDPRLGKDPQPDSMAGYVTTTSDNGGVHINSGIPNRAFAEAATAVGGKAWLTVGPVWYDVLTGSGIRPTCDFAAFAALTISAAATRYGRGHAVTDAITHAWSLVGVAPGTSGHDPSADASPTDASARLTLTRSGGVTGVVRTRTVALADMPRSDAALWTDLLASRRLTALADDSDAFPDTFRYEVSCDSYEVDVDVPETALEQQERALFRRTLHP